ncbi:hypothetical protein KR009_003809 [Drosophila setifemur]|nr:hypothetical protein KR009_003809 [Drosophila setifemur]
MQNTKSVENAQTQHGDAGVDVENIFLHRFMLFTNTVMLNVPSTQPTVGDDPQVSLIAKKVSHLPKKRKASSAEEPISPKRANLDDKELKTKRPGFSDERYDETSYYFENGRSLLIINVNLFLINSSGLRKVYPYFFTFTTYAKGRWVNDKILDVFAREFRAAPPEEYERSLEAGKLTVNQEKVHKDYKIKHNDLLANVVHRHEVPVTSQPIKIVYMDKDIVVVNKPASIPVHPCGRYRHNTVVFILAKDHNLKNLRTIHRLDRLTSGLLLFGRNSQKARELEQQIRNRQVQKEYVCRVEGRFPDGIVECCEPIDVVSYKIGVCKVSSKGKDCKTTFRRIGEVGDGSIVICKPLTGRMHQIRVHLQYLGYPIENDPLYNHEVFGPLKGRGGDMGGLSDEQLIDNLISIHNAENWLAIEEKKDDRTENKDKLNSSTGKNSEGRTMVFPEAPVTDAATQTCHEEPDNTFDPKKFTFDPHCSECKINYRDPEANEMVMYLHAWKYRGVNWEYKTELPNWACEKNINYDDL